MSLFRPACSYIVDAEQKLKKMWLLQTMPLCSTDVPRWRLCTSLDDFTTLLSDEVTHWQTPICLPALTSCHIQVVHDWPPLQQPLLRWFTKSKLTCQVDNPAVLLDVSLASSQSNSNSLHSSDSELWRCTTNDRLNSWRLLTSNFHHQPSDRCFCWSSILLLKVS